MTEPHRCEGELPTEGDAGPAIDLCEESSDGSLWVFGTDGVTSQVGFCPYCGFRASIIPMAVAARMLKPD